MDTAKRRPPKDYPPIIYDEIVIKQVAAIALTGASEGQIATQLGKSRYFIKKVLNDPKFKEFLERTAEQEIVPVVLQAKAKLNKLVEKAVLVLAKALDNDDIKIALEASKQVLKAAGFEKHEDRVGDTQISVILPGAAEPKDIIHE